MLAAPARIADRIVATAAEHFGGTRLDNAVVRVTGAIASSGMDSEWPGIYFKFLDVARKYNVFDRLIKG
jgi:hypothetical protein